MTEKPAKSPMWSNGVFFGVSGLAFVLCNLLWARILSVEEYGQLALMIALLNLSLKFAPLGTDGILNRQQVAPDGRMIVLVCAWSTLVGIAAALITHGLYGTSLALNLLLVIATLAGSITSLAASAFQARREFSKSLLFFHSHNGTLLIAAVAGLVFSHQTALEPWLWMTLLMMAVAGISLSALWKLARLPGESKPLFQMQEALVLLAISGSGEMMTQLERLITPYLLGLQDLAQLGILLAIVGPPFRLLELTVGYTMLPLLRAAEGPTQRKELLAKEGLRALAIVVVSCVALEIVTPTVVRLFLDNKYVLPNSLVVAALIAGSVKVANGFGRAAATALGTHEQLTHFALMSWIAIGVAALCAFLGSQWGLPGVIYGVTAGWIFRAILSARLIATAVHTKRIA